MQASKVHLWTQASVKELEHRFNETIMEYDFIKHKNEPCVYKKVSKNAIIFIVLYVDDILLIENDIPILQSTKIWLSKKLSMKDLGKTSYVLGIRIYEIDPEGFLVSYNPHT